MQRAPRTATRDRILSAALEVFAGKGYHRAIVDDIVRASGTSKGAVYHHFPNKEAVFIALVFVAYVYIWRKGGFEWITEEVTPNETEGTVERERELEGAGRAR